MKNLLLILLGLVFLACVLPACSFFCKKKCCDLSLTGGELDALVKAKSKNVIFSFLGAAGSGKGTIAEESVRSLGFKVLSTGNLCRAEIAVGSERGKLIQSYTNSGKLVPDVLIAEMVDNWLAKEVGTGAPIILDGYPRTQKQAEILLDLIKSKYPKNIFRVVSLVIPDEEIVKRLADRLMCENKKCQAVYSRSLLKPEEQENCKACGSKLIRREDDKEEVVRERLRVYAQHSGALFAFYKNTGQEVEELNVSGLPVSEVFTRFKQLCVK